MIDVLVFDMLIAGGCCDGSAIAIATLADGTGVLSYRCDQNKAELIGRVLAAEKIALLPQRIYVGDVLVYDVGPEDVSERA